MENKKKTGIWIVCLVMLTSLLVLSFNGNSNTETIVSANDTTIVAVDTVAVDTVAVDTVAVDSVAVDSVAVDSSAVE